MKIHFIAIIFGLVVGIVIGVIYEKLSKGKK